MGLHGDRRGTFGVSARHPPSMLSCLELRQDMTWALYEYRMVDLMSMTDHLGYESISFLQEGWKGGRVLWGYCTVCGEGW